MEPTNPISEIRQLARRYLDGATDGVEVWSGPIAELRQRDLATDDLIAIVATDLGSSHCYDTQQTRKYHPATVSDYFSIWVDDCACFMFLKLLIFEGRLHITSFKKDRRRHA